MIMLMVTRNKAPVLVVAVEEEVEGAEEDMEMRIVTMRPEAEGVLPEEEGVDTQVTQDMKKKVVTLHPEVEGVPPEEEEGEDTMLTMAMIKIVTMPHHMNKVGTMIMALHQQEEEDMLKVAVMELQEEMMAMMITQPRILVAMVLMEQRLMGAMTTTQKIMVALQERHMELQQGEVARGTANMMSNMTNMMQNPIAAVVEVGHTMAVMMTTTVLLPLLGEEEGEETEVRAVVVIGVAEVVTEVAIQVEVPTGEAILAEVDLIEEDTPEVEEEETGVHQGGVEPTVEGEAETEAGEEGQRKQDISPTRSNAVQLQALL